MKYGDVYYHVYIMDDIDASVVKILGPKETSVEVKGFN
jgi:hypothetical protein